MFCPQCKAEYRQGIAECADCQVPLVSSLPDAGESLVDTMPAGKLAPLWEGEDLALHTSLLQQLDAAGIRYFSKPMGVFPGARKGDPFPIQPMARFGYQVTILSSSLPQARALLERLLDEEPADMELPEDNEPAKAPTECPATGDEEPTMEIWSGDNENFVDFLHAALRENKIPLRSAADGTDKKVYVRPSDAARAEEIVRELTEGTPPR